MKLPRNLSGAELAKALSRVGARITRQTGSHIRLTTSQFRLIAGDLNHRTEERG